MATDEDLAVQVAAGSAASFEELVSRYSPRLFNFLRPRISSHQDIEDIIQETFLRIYRGIERFDSEKKFSTWFYTIAVRLTISHFRTTTKCPPKVTEPFSGSDPQDRLILKQTSRNLWIKARELKTREYEALWLRYVEDLSVKDIARIMKKTPVAVRVALHRARLRLADKMDTEENGAAAESETRKGNSLSYLREET